MKALAALLPLAFLFACASADAGEDNVSDGDGEEQVDVGASELSSSVRCATTQKTAYSGGSAIGTVAVIQIGGKAVTEKTGHAFLKFQRAAAAAGVDIAINSGFRTMDEQRYFYGCYQSGNCNGGNLAAKPGFSNHQSGRAIDISNSRSAWVQNNAARFGFRRTVPSETWHFEYFGDDVGGPCSDGGAASNTCFSNTLGRDIPAGECVQSKFNSKWFRCDGTEWNEIAEGAPNCSKRFPL
jgi:hypothetical protein